MLKLCFFFMTIAFLLEPNVVVLREQDNDATYKLFAKPVYQRKFGRKHILQIVNFPVLRSNKAID